MSRASTVTGTVTRVIRHGHTVYGNPMMSITVQAATESFADSGMVYATETFRISNNASMVYAIENPEYRDGPHTFALTVAGRISHIVR